MKICFICNEYPPAPHGGIGTFVQNLARHLVNNNHEVYVIGYDSTFTNKRHCNDRGVNVIRLFSPFDILKNKSYFRYWRAPFIFFGERYFLDINIRKLINQYKLNIIESYDFNGPLLTKPSIPLIIRLHGSYTANQFYEKRKINKLSNFIEYHNIKLADGVVAVSEYISNITQKAFKLKKNIKIIYNGIDTNIFKPMENIIRDVRKVIFVGSITRRKGIFSLLEAIPKVLEMCPETKFSFIGRFPKEKKEHLLMRLPASSRASVHFAGFVPHTQLPWEYNKASIAVFPSFAEAFGLTCAEAMATGTAVVMSSLASGPELVEHEISGMLINPAKPDGLANSIVTLVKNPDMRYMLGIKARERVLKLFSIENQVKNNIAFYERFIPINIKL